MNAVIEAIKPRWGTYGIILKKEGSYGTKRKVDHEEGRCGKAS